MIKKIKTISYLLSITYLLFLSASSYAQSNTFSSEIGNGKLLLNHTFLPGNGVILMTGENDKFKKSLGYEIVNLDKDLNVRWRKGIDRVQISKGNPHDLVASPKGDYVYFVENDWGNAITDMHYLHIHQFDSKGNVNSFDIDFKKDFKVKFGYIAAFFANSHHFYILEKSVYDIDKITSGTYKLHAYDSKSFIRETTELELPSLLPYDPKKDMAPYWSFMERNEDELYLVAHRIQLKRQSQNFDILTLDFKGAIKNHTKLELPTPNGYLASIHSNLKTFNGNANNETGFGRITYNSIEGWTSQSYSFAGFYKDQQDGSIYLYSLLGATPHDPELTKLKNVIAAKFDATGKLLWNNTVPFTKEMLSDNFFSYRGSISKRNVYFNSIKSANQLELQMYYNPKKMYYISFDGKSGNATYAPIIPAAPSKQYVANFAEGMKPYDEFYYYRSSEGDYIIEFKEKGSFTVKVSKF